MNDNQEQKDIELLKDIMLFQGKRDIYKVFGFLIWINVLQVLMTIIGYI